MSQARSLAAAQRAPPVRVKGKKAAQNQGQAGAASPDAKGGVPTAWLPMQGCWAALTLTDVSDVVPVHCHA